MPDLVGFLNTSFSSSSEALFSSFPPLPRHTHQCAHTLDKEGVAVLPQARPLSVPAESGLTQDLGQEHEMIPSWKNKGKGEKERYNHLQAEFQRLARKDKKAFLTDQCKEIEESNRMGKTRDLFKKITDTKGTFHAKMGTIKDRNGMDLIEAEDIKQRWQEYTEELYKKIFMTQITTTV